MGGDNIAEVLAALDRLIAATDGFVAAWGEPSAAALSQLERFAGRLPDDYRAFASRYGNVHVGYLPVAALGSGGVPEAQALTEERQAKWPAFPAGCLALSEHNSDLIVLRPDGAVEFRSESSRDLAVFRSFPTFTAFMRHAVDWAAGCAARLGRVPPGFNPWRAEAEPCNVPIHLNKNSESGRVGSSEV